MKKPETKEREYTKIESFVINRVTQYHETVFVDLTLNGISIHGCKIVEGKNGDFIGFPNYKGKDGKYYSYVYVALSSDDQKAILDEIEKELNK